MQKYDIQLEMKNNKIYKKNYIRKMKVINNNFIYVTNNYFHKINLHLK